MADLTIRDVRSEIRNIVDPLLLKLRQDIYGSGITYFPTLPNQVPPGVITSGDLDAHRNQSPIDHPDGSVTDDKLSDSGITEGDYAYPALISVNAKGRVYDIVEGSHPFTDPTTFNGDMIYRASSTTTRLPVGTNGQFLSVSGGLPTWVTLTIPSGTAPETFLDLIDTPNSYTGQGLKYVRVSEDETALEFVTATPGSGGSGSGTSNGITLWVPNAPPVTAHAKDDEFDDQSIGGQWTIFDYPSQLTATEEEYGLNLRWTPTSSYRVVGILEVAPSGDFTIFTKVDIVSPSTNYVSAGIVLAEGTANDSDLITYFLWSGDNAITQYNTWSDYANVGGTALSVTQGVNVTSIYLRLRKAGSTIYADYSNDGVSWKLSGSQSAPGWSIGYIGLAAAGNTSTESEAIFPFLRVSTNTGYTTILKGRRLNL